MCRSRWLFAALVLIAGFPAPARDPYGVSSVSTEMREGLPLSKASVQGKYSNLLRTISCPADKANYGEFNDYGYYTGAVWQQHTNIPAGHWVYVYPRWYIWGEKLK